MTVKVQQNAARWHHLFTSFISCLKSHRPPPVTPPATDPSLHIYYIYPIRLISNTPKNWRDSVNELDRV